MNPLLKTREVAYYLGDAGTKAIFAWHTALGEAHSGADKAGAEAIVVNPETLQAVLVELGVVLGGATPYASTLWPLTPASFFGRSPLS
jgi:hypothetical protein